MTKKELKKLSYILNAEDISNISTKGCYSLRDAEGPEWSRISTAYGTYGRIGTLYKGREKFYYTESSNFYALD